MSEENKAIIEQEPKVEPMQTLLKEIIALRPKVDNKGCGCNRNKIKE